MRRQYFYWGYLVLAIVATVYGAYSIIYSINHEKEIPILAITFASVGIVMLLIFAVLFTISLFQRKKIANNQYIETEEEYEEELELQEEKIEQPQTEVAEAEEPVEEPTEEEPVEAEEDDSGEVVFERVRPASCFRGGSAYINKVGYGPVLRVSGPQIVDMRTNTYYRIEDNYVKREGSGPVFEISGNKIKAAYGSYLYEISGSNVNKVFGGFYASISEGSIQLYDLSERYEISDSLNLSQKLAVVAILFGTY